MSTSFPRLAALVAPFAVALLGCGKNAAPPSGNRVNGPASTSAPGADVEGNGAHVDARVDGAAPDGAPRQDDVKVDVAPGGGVDVKVQGEPIRDRLRQRREAREAEAADNP
jgi:hypothetical protein